MDGEYVSVGCLVSVPEHDFNATLDFADKWAYDVFGAGNGTAWICDKLEISMFIKLPEVDAIVSTLNKLVFDLKGNQYVPGERTM